jgi:hypothetical protein
MSVFYITVGVMEDYKLRDSHASHTLGCLHVYCRCATLFFFFAFGHGVGKLAPIFYRGLIRFWGNEATSTFTHA